MEVVVEKQKTTEKAGKKLSELLKKHKNKDILLMVSGGSAFTVLEHVDSNTLSEQVTLSVVDERFSMDPKVNNFSQLEQTGFFDACMEKGCAIIGTRIHKTETLPKAVLNFDSQLRRWRQAHPKGVILTLLGLGEDGHTAGVLPFPENRRLFDDLFLDEEWVASFDATGKNEYTLRFTTTLTFLRDETAGSVVYVQGEKKKKALELVQSDTAYIQEVPGKIFLDMNNVTLVTDQEVSGL